MPSIDPDTRATVCYECAEPMDGERCEWCGSEVDDGCTPECDCPDCEVQRALDEDADMAADAAADREYRDTARRSIAAQQAFQRRWEAERAAAERENRS